MYMMIIYACISWWSAETIRFWTKPFMIDGDVRIIDFDVPVIYNLLFWKCNSAGLN